ncbi:hypothetical protein [Streptomyces sp. NPDC013457]|uniref:hypothetical protein n=1 Tax=Streptomyces sp. NPDC013457 TaxID=3364866 RepID=UPI0036F7127F
MNLAAETNESLARMSDMLIYSSAMCCLRNSKPSDYGHLRLKVYAGAGTGKLRAPTWFADRLRSSTFAF